jgi:hypothetical protein
VPLQLLQLQLLRCLLSLHLLLLVVLLLLVLWQVLVEVLLLPRRQLQLLLLLLLLLLLMLVLWVHWRHAQLQVSLLKSVPRLLLQGSWLQLLQCTHVVVTAVSAAAEACTIRQLVLLLTLLLLQRCLPLHVRRCSSKLIQPHAPSILLLLMLLLVLLLLLLLIRRHSSASSSLQRGLLASSSQHLELASARVEVAAQYEGVRAGCYCCCCCLKVSPVA